MNWKLKRVKTSDLKEFPQNPRALTKKGLADLKKSIQKFGLAEPLVINTDLTICGGHGRLKVLQDLKITEVDCYLPEQQLSEQEFKELNIRLNKNIAGEFDFDILANFFEVDNLKEWGFLENELLNTFNAKDDNYEIPNEIKTDIVLGDLFEIGKHRLLCGSSVEFENWSKVMGDNLADLIVTDPPYNVSYVGKTKNKLTIKNDNMNDKQFYKFLLDFYSALASYTREGGGGMFGMLIQKVLILEWQ